ncbi:hypothetical protein SAY86_023910 [Trapa natans]|uniref:Uncharacterized protein n=1 Tax=Trapa natans TaxID=22666 RepID=A0AAN7R9R6_TRANT|nr:hypothetical protein SAY86_023910 [Trapa natans]
MCQLKSSSALQQKCFLLLESINQAERMEASSPLVFSLKRLYKQDTTLLLQLLHSSNLLLFLSISGICFFSSETQSFLVFQLLPRMNPKIIYFSHFHQVLMT